MHRFFTDEQGIQDGKACLEQTDAHHALRVLRLTCGDPVVLMDGKGLYRAILQEIQGDRVLCAVQEALQSPEPSLHVTLYQGVPKADKLEWIVQKCTEVGVMKIVPIALSRCVSQITPKDGPKKTERWQKIAREAAKQSGRAIVPEVSLPLSLTQAIERMKYHEAVLAPWEEATGFGPAAAHAKYQHAQDLAIVIGPEGGIAPEEMKRLVQEAGAVPITLGKRILRTETAGLAALTALLTLWGDMG